MNFQNIFFKKERAISLLLQKNNNYFINSASPAFKDISFKKFNNNELMYSYNPYWNINNIKPVIGDFYANVFLKNKKDGLIFKPKNLYSLLYKLDVVLWISVIIYIFFFIQL